MEMYAKSSYRLSLLLIVGFIILPLMTACSPEIESRSEVHKDLKDIMEKRVQAIKNKDIIAYGKLFLPEYLDGGVDHQMLMEEMESQFSASETIEFSFVKNPMNYTMNTARMVSMVSYKTNNMEKPVFHHERTVFRRINGEWFICGGVAIGLF